MRVLYVGNFSRPWQTEVHLANDFARIPGVTVAMQQEPRPAEWERFLGRIETDASNADLLLYTKTHGLPPEATELWRRVEARGTRTASFHLDLYFGLAREREAGFGPAWTTGIVFTADGDPTTTARLAARGIDHRWIPAAIHSADAWVAAPEGHGGTDIIFVGSSHYHPEWPWRTELLDGLHARYGSRFRQFPDGGERIHGRRLNTLYASAPIIVGDSLALPGHRNYWSDRFYETVGRGGYLIGPNVPGMEAHFTGGEHLDLYDLGDLDHVFELVDQAQGDREGTRQIGRAGHEHVKAHHTYRHRAEQILHELGLAE